jgi:hypothetical protein
MPPTDVKDLYQWAVKNNKPYHKIFATWANREGYKSVAPALQKAGNLDSDALDYWTPRVWEIYWGEVRGIDSEMPPEWAKKRIPDELRDYLDTVFDAYDRIVFDWPTEYRQIGEQGVAEGTGQFHVYHKVKGDRMGGPDYELLKSFPDKNSAVVFAKSYNEKHGYKRGGFHGAVIRTTTPAQGVAEAKDDYVPPKEANYDDKYQAMVRRVGEKARAQEKAKQQQPKAPVRESRLALLKQIIQS